MKKSWVRNIAKQVKIQLVGENPILPLSRWAHHGALGCPTAFYSSPRAAPSKPAETSSMQPLSVAHPKQLQVSCRRWEEEWVFAVSPGAAPGEPSVASLSCHSLWLTWSSSRQATESSGERLLHHLHVLHTHTQSLKSDFSANLGGPLSLQKYA